MGVIPVALAFAAGVLALSLITQCLTTIPSSIRSSYISSMKAGYGVKCFFFFSGASCAETWCNDLLILADNIVLRQTRFFQIYSSTLLQLSTSLSSSQPFFESSEVGSSVRRCSLSVNFRLCSSFLRRLLRYCLTISAVAQSFWNRRR